MLSKTKNIFSQIKRSNVALSLLILLAVPQALYASEEKQLTESVFEKSKAKIYQFISKKEYLIAPISAAIAGGRLCGLPCFAGGAAAGTIDELSVFFGLTKKRYLTFGIFGSAIGHMFNPSSKTASIAGFSLGILYKVDMPNNSKWRLLPGIVSAIASGNPAGALYGIIDELLVYKGAIDDHPFTAMALGNKIVTQLFDTKLASTTIFNKALARLGFDPVEVFDFTGAVLGSVIGAVLADHEAAITKSVTTSIQETKKIHAFQSKFVSEERLDELAEKQEMALIGGYFGLDVFNTKIAGYTQALNYHLEHLDDVGGQVWGKYLKVLGNFAIFVFPCGTMKATTTSVNKYFADQREHAWEDQLKDKFFSEEAFLRLSQKHNVSASITGLMRDVNELVWKESKLTTNAISATLNGVGGIGVLIIHSPDVFVYSLLYAQAQAFISNILWQQVDGYYEESSEINFASKKIVARYSDPENIKTIAAMGGSGGFMQQELKRLNALSITCNAKIESWSSLARNWGSISRALGFLIEETVLGYKIKKGKIANDKKGEIFMANRNAVAFFETLSQTKDGASLDAALDRVTALEKIVDSPLACDKINRINIEGNQLILRNLNMRVDDPDGVIKSTAVRVDDIKLEMGKAYAFDGCSGGGKSLLLTKINKVVANGVGGTGDIYYPLVNGKEAKIVLVTQAKYFESDSSLYQVIIWPDKIPSDPVLSEQQKKTIQELLKKLGLSNFVDSLDSVKDSWDAVFSPGQQRRIKLIAAFIRAITQKPDILILDETFTGIDSKRIKIMQAMLKEQLPNALILVVDHHASDNNHNHFYSNEKLHLENGVVTLQDIDMDSENCNDD